MAVDASKMPCAELLRRMVDLDDYTHVWADDVPLVAGPGMW
jgi:hypothetical protein